MSASEDHVLLTMSSQIGASSNESCALGCTEGHRVLRMLALHAEGRIVKGKLGGYISNPSLRYMRHMCYYRFVPHE